MSIFQYELNKHSDKREIKHRTRQQTTQRRT